MVRRDLAGVSLAEGHRLRAGGQRWTPLAEIEERISRRVSAGHQTPNLPRR
jgi:hypothetical protein